MVCKPILVLSFAFGQAEQLGVSSNHEHHEQNVDYVVGDLLLCQSIAKLSPSLAQAGLS